MAALRRIVIVGRPNVGKSTLLNRLRRSRVSIVEPTAGVTRDRVSVPVRLDSEGGERVVEVVDTGGIGIVDRDDLDRHVEEQIRAALLSADLALFVVDAREGVTPLDEEVARRLRDLDCPVLLVLNKSEGERATWNEGEFHRLGVGGEPLAISAQNGTGVDRLVEAVVAALPESEGEERLPAPGLKIAVVGRRNAGKSTLVNALVREERAIVSEVPGTTRDALDVIVERDGETFVVIDTAGVRRRKRHADAIEFFSDARSLKAIRRCDVVILLVDAMAEVGAIDKRLARYAKDHHRVVLLAANKWDLALERGGVRFADYEAYLRRELPGLAHAPVLALSAKTGRNVSRAFRTARDLHARAQTRVSTGELNRVVQRALEGRSPGAGGRHVRIRYATQTATLPPTIVLFVDDKRWITKATLRYLENRLREGLPFAGLPIRLVLRDKRQASLGETRSS